MNRFTQLVCAAVLLGSYTVLQAGPFEGKTFKGRIAYSADGNHNDQDDWAASPMAVAIFAAAGVSDKVVHFDYNSILPKTEPEWEQKHADSVLGAAKRYGYEMTVFMTTRKNLDNAVESIRKAIDDSSAETHSTSLLRGPWK